MSSLPTVIMENIVINVPDERSQLKMHSLAHFAELCKHLYEQIQTAKHVQRPA
jgi:NitT/TauT family transport system ATP-binding protein